MPETPTKKQPTDLSAALPTDESDKLLERLRSATRGEYEILGELGRGGMATVYLAHEISLDRKVAIKVMAPGMVYASGLVERFKREARTAANLSHPNIIPIYAVREADDLLFCVIKLVRGTPLDGIMRELGELPARMVQAILAQVGDALAYAHRHGVVHRDIKPGNILIDDDGWAVVTDFGIAKVPELEGLTLTGVTVGTPTYMSPEQCSGGDVSGASDQYSLGVVAYEMLAGRPPFTGTSMMALLYSHFHDTPPALATLRPDCPPVLCDAVMRMLNKDPADRWPSLELAIAAMGAEPLARDDPTRDQLIALARTSATHRIVSQIHTPRSPIPLGHKRRDDSLASPTQVRRRSALLGAGAVVLLGVGYLIARFATPGAPPESPRVAAETTATATKNAAIPPRDSAPASVREQVPPTIPNVREGKSTTAPPTAQPQRLAAKPSVDSAASKVAARQVVPNATPPGSLTVDRSVKAESSAAAVLATPPPVRPPVTAVQPQTQAPNVVAPLVDERAEVRALILSFARALAASDLAGARRLYPGMPNDQREGFEALWKQGTLTPRWTVSDIFIEGAVATARISGVNVHTERRGATTEVPVALRARLERRGTEWRLVALIN